MADDRLSARSFSTQPTPQSSYFSPAGQVTATPDTSGGWIGNSGTPYNEDVEMCQPCDVPPIPSFPVPGVHYHQVRPPPVHPGYSQTPSSYADSYTSHGQCMATCEPAQEYQDMYYDTSIRTDRHPQATSQRLGTTPTSTSPPIQNPSSQPYYHTTSQPPATRSTTTLTLDSTSQQPYHPPSQQPSGPTSTSSPTLNLTTSQQHQLNNPNPHRTVNQQSTQQIQIPPYGFYSAPSALTSSLSPLEAVSTPPPPPPPPPPSSEPEYLSSAKTAQKLRKLLQAVPELDPRLYNVGEVTNPGGPEGEGEREGGRRREPDEPPLRGNTPSTPPSHVPAEYRHLHHHPPPPPNRDPAATMLLKPRREISEEQVRRSNDLHVALSDNFKGLVGGFKTLWEKPS